MKKIEAILRPAKVDEVKESVERIGLRSLTVSEVHGFGRQKGHAQMYRGAEYVVQFQPKVKLEVIAKDELVPQIVAAICQAARTGRIGDGKIFVLPMDDSAIARPDGPRRASAI